MIRKLLLFLCLTISLEDSFGQSGESPNVANAASLSSGSAQASKLGSVPMSLFTGRPNISVPIHSYSGNGIGLNISIQYSGAGGIQVGEAATFVGLGWYLDAGGAITRTVKGMPDDVPTYGFMYAGAIPSDYRADGNKYYHDSIDAQQDIFQYNCPGGSGKFLIGKNGQIVIIPAAKIKIIPTFQTPNYISQTLKSFRIIFEDGVKYDFEDIEASVLSVDNNSFVTGYNGKTYATAWQLTRIISAFNTDTIKFSYTSRSQSSQSSLPQVTYINNATGYKKYTNVTLSSTISTNSLKINSIEFPNQTKLSFTYSLQQKYSTSDYALSKIKVEDSIFRRGYLLEYDTAFKEYNSGGGTYEIPLRLLLKSVTPFTAFQKDKGYKFIYYRPQFPELGSVYDSIQNKKDHWGFYNAAINGTNYIPSGLGYTPSANRNPDYHATANALADFYLPTGGYISYYYSNNDHYPWKKDTNALSITPTVSSQNTVTLSQVFNTRHELIFMLDKSVARTGSVPISGSGNLIVNIKSTDGSILYLTVNISLQDLYYKGMKTWKFNLANGTYRLETSLSSGTTITGSFPLSIKWNNKLNDPTVNSVIAGGLRLAAVARYAENIIAPVSMDYYKYLTGDGKSSGFLGDIPTYTYQFREIANYNGTTTTDYTAVNSIPVSTTDYTQGSTVGYSRVEITHWGEQNNGKEVVEFTDLKDVNANNFSTFFPYTQKELRGWGLGLPKITSAYDSSGNLVKRTLNNYGFDSSFYLNDNFKSLKLGHSQTTYNGNPTLSTTPKVKLFIGEEYYPEGGRVYLISTKDSLYHSNGSISDSYKTMEYDTNYNVKKVITSFNRSQSLNAEQRMYYSYDYSMTGTIAKLRDSGMKNSPIATETWITGAGNPRLAAATMSNFKQISNGDIKPDTSFALVTNAPLDQSVIGLFDPTKLNRNTNWFKPQQVAVNYDTKGNLTETKAIRSGLKNSIIMDYGLRYPVAKVSNAANVDVAYSSFESDGSGGWTVGSSARDLSSAYSGKKSYNISNGNISKSSLSSGQTYLVTVWAKAGASFTINTVYPGSSIATHNGWYLYQKSFSGITTLTISGSGLLDELRLHPTDANMMTYTYEPTVGVTSTVDANNTVIHTEYDKLLRVKLLRDQDLNILKKYEYSDTAMLINFTPIWEAVGKDCDSYGYGGWDSLYRDINTLSDSSGFVKRIHRGTDFCTCSTPGNYPQYKFVNGICEQGTKFYSSSYRQRYPDNGPGSYWRYFCTYYYKWSDLSVSSNYTEWSDTPCLN